MKDLFGNEITQQSKKSNKPKVKESKIERKQSLNSSELGLNANWKNFGEVIRDRGNKTP